jgi:hypothetical protein
MAPQTRPPTPYLIFTSIPSFIDHTSHNAIVLVTFPFLPLFQ